MSTPSSNILEKFMPKLTYAYTQTIPNKVSVIVLCYNNEKTLSACLDSILLQKSAVDVEIIVVDDASSDGTQDIIQRYIGQYPKIVRSMRQPENKGAGHARNSGMCMAKGEFMAFVDSDDCMAPHFLEKALRIMQEEQADIVAFDMVIVRQNPHHMERWGVTPGVFSGKESLEQFALKNAGGYGSVNRVYRVEMLREKDISYGTMKTHEDMVFSVAAFYHSTKTVICDDIGYYKHESSDSLFTDCDHAKYFKSFVRFVTFLEFFFTSHKLDTQSIACQRILTQIYTRGRAHLCTVIQDAMNKNTMDELFTEDIIHSLDASSNVLNLILQDYAKLVYYNTTPRPSVAKEHLDWQKDADEPWPSPVCIPYANADTPSTVTPILSVVIPNYNRKDYLDNCLAAVLKQVTNDIEVIIIDDASTDGCYETLQSYAKKHEAIRLYRMQENCRQGICRNIGIEKARGQYITFVDSDDIVGDTFFKDGIKAIQEHNADIVIYSVQTVYDDGTACTEKILPNIILNEQEFLQLYCEHKIHPAPHAKIYRLTPLRQHNICYPPYIYHQDHPFFVDFINKASICLCSSTVQYTYILSKNSSIRPKSYSWLHIHSCCKFFNFLQETASMLPKDTNIVTKLQGHMIWNFNNIFAPACAAFSVNTPQLPFSTKDMALVRNSPLFIKTLFSCFSKAVKDTGVHNLLGDFQSERSVPYKGESRNETPLISIIIPVYNQEEHLGRCLDAILTQSFMSYEILLVDDASTDHTAQVCANYANKDARIKVFTNEQNRGQGYSRNFAMEKARAPYVTFVDSDDYIEPILLHRGVQTLEDMPDVDIVHFDYEARSVNNEHKWWGRVQQGLRTGRDVFQEFCLNKVPFAMQWAKVYRKNFFDAYSIQSPQYLWEDVLFSLKSFYFAKQVFFTGLHGYTQVVAPHEASAIAPQKLTPKHVHGRCHLLKDIEAFGMTLSNKQDKEYVEKLSTSFVQDRFALLLPYMDSCLKRNVFPIDNNALESLTKAPTFLKALLEHFAELHAKHTNYKPVLPKEDLMNTDNAWVKTAEELITLVDRTPTTQVDISVIVSAFNAGETLAQCLDSILTQDAHFEIILVEDNSTSDNTLKICLEYAKKHNCIRLFQTPWNSDLGTIRNLAIQKAQGEYITFIDGKDWIEPHFFQHAFQKLSLHTHINIFLCNMQTHWPIKALNSQVPDAILADEVRQDQYICENLNHLGTQGYFYKKDFLIQNNICFGKHFHADEIFLYNIYAHANSIILCSYVGYNCRHNNETSIMEDKLYNKKDFESTIENLNMLNVLFNKYKLVLKKHSTKKALENFIYKEHHIYALFQYIYACKALGLSSPLTQERLAVLTQNSLFFTAFLKEYILLTQKI